MRGSSADPVGAGKVAAIPIGLPSGPRVFTLSEAGELFPLVQRLTGRSYHALQPIRERLLRMVPADPRRPRLEADFEVVIRRWQSDMGRLGVVARGLWLVEFDTSDGFLCWRWPELRIAHYRGYGEEFAARRPLQAVIEELDPDWACN